MHPIQQRKNQCSIASLAILNGFDQADYGALADICESQIAGYARRPSNHIAKAVQICRDLGLQVPKGYLDDRCSNLWPQAQPEHFAGKGIAWVKFSPASHVVAYNDGKIIDSDRREFDSWEAYRKFWYKRRKRIKLIKVFPL